MSVLSYDTNKHWKTKLQRISDRSATQSGAVFNNLGYILSETMLTDIFHSQRGEKAVGVDRVTKEEYGKDLPGNISRLMKRIRNGSYRPQASRVVKIPKASGGVRPLAISCFEDKLVQTAAKKILEAIYEPLFKENSHGFRPKRSCHTALRALSGNLYQLFSGAVVEVDLKKCFDTIPHEKLFDTLQKRVKDKRFLTLLRVLVRAPYIEEAGKRVINRIGCPQGSVLSPLLCNIYLDEVLDQWFEEIQPHFKGKQQNQVRYCDDVVWTFGRYEDARKFYRVLPKRLAKYGLTMNMEKSGIIRSGSRYSQLLARDKKRSKVFQFLGFNIFWKRSRHGPYRATFKSRSKCMQDIVRRLTEYMYDNLNTSDFKRFLRGLYSRIRGWMKYHSISGNQGRVSSFAQICQRLLYRWWNRRSQRQPVSWKRFPIILKRLKFPTLPKAFSLYGTLNGCVSIYL